MSYSGLSVGPASFRVLSIYSGLCFAPAIDGRCVHSDRSPDVPQNHDVGFSSVWSSRYGMEVANDFVDSCQKASSSHHRLSL